MRPRDRAALVLVALAVAFAALAVGGAPRWAACIAAFLGIATAVPYVTSRRTASRMSPLLLPLVVAVGLTALQLVPLPRAIAEQLVPAKLELVTANATALGEPAPAWVMASYDPPATLVELAKLLGYLGLAFTCVRLATIRRARHWLAVIVAGVATTVAILTLVHHALGATALYGVFSPQVKPHILGPLFGVNHLASLLSIAVPVALSLALACSGIARGGWLAAAATLTATTLLTGSRGGLIGLVAGVVVVIVLLLVQRRSGTDDSGRRVSLAVVLPGAVVALCAVVLLAVLSAGDVAGELSRTTLDEVHEPHSKFQVWDHATTIVTDNRWLGVGKGGFEAAFTRVSGVGDLTYSHVENDYLQAVVDWGLPGAAALALALLTAARAAARRWRHGPLEAGVIGGLASLIVHDVADFSLELPSVAMMIIAAAAILVPAKLGTDPTEKSAAPVASRRAVGTRASLIVAGTATIALAASPVGRTMRADANRVGDEPDADNRLALAREAWRRHPSDYILAGRVAEGLFARRDPRAIKVIARGLAMNPLHPGLHHLAGRMLAQTKARAQAGVEFAAAARWTLDVRPIVADVLAVFREPEEIAHALPTEPRQIDRLLEALQDHPHAALAYAARMGELYPRDAHVQYQLATVAYNAGRPDLAVPAARAAWRLQLLARHATSLGLALALAGDRREAIAVLTEADERAVGAGVAERVALLFTLADLQVASGDLEGAKRTLDRAATVALAQIDLAIATHLRMADLEDRLGHKNQAEWERGEARRLADQAGANNTE